MSPTPEHTDRSGLTVQHDKDTYCNGVLFCLLVVYEWLLMLVSEMARKVAEMKMRKKAEKEQQREMLHRARQLRGFTSSLALDNELHSSHCVIMSYHIIIYRRP